MDLILWRHAEAHVAQAAQDDFARRLTAKGEKHAARMGRWLDQQLPEGTRVLCSPAVRAEQTVRALGRKYKLRDALSPGATVQDLIDTAAWPQAKYPVMLVGHQPELGQLLAHLLGMDPALCPIRKGAAWWLRSRVRGGLTQTVVLSVTTPERL